ncbi:MAG: WYL domain-containing protein [Gemmatimonadales bacterium]|nr:WYL domain-containing protein [Gemmatimonadales bacterium]
MSDTAAAQLRRLLQLVPRIADGREHRIAPLAARLGTTPGQLKADLRILAERYDDPAGFYPGLALFVGPDTVRVQSSHFQRPMRLSLAELRALELGLLLLERERPEEERPVIASARGQLARLLAGRRAAPPEPPLPARVAAEPSVPAPALLDTLRRAARQRRVVRLRYRGAAASADQERRVRPAQVLCRHGAWYLAAWCEQRDDWRFFRLDRMSAAEATADRFAPLELAALESRLHDGAAFFAVAARVLRVRYAPAVAGWIAERLGRPRDDDGALVVEHPMADPDWAVRHVLQYGPDVRVLEPDTVRAEAVRRLDALLAALGDAP